MEEETFIPRWEDLNTTETEQQILIVNEEDDLIKESELENALVCKILTSKIDPMEGFRYIMPSIWNCDADVTIRNVGENLYICIFRSRYHKRMILANSPWSYENSLLVFEHPLRRNCTFQDLEFKYASFWIHFHDLPLACYSRKMAVVFGNAVGIFEKVETDRGEMCWGRTLRVRVKIDVKKPLRRVVKLRVMGEVSLIRMSYEGLPDFCYGCGKLGHVLNECDLHYEGNLQYGDWLREGMEGEEEEDWEEEFDGRENQMIFRPRELARDSPRESPESRLDGGEREMVEEDSSEDGMEEMKEGSVGVVSGESKDLRDEKMEESMRKSGENGGVAGLGMGLDQMDTEEQEGHAKK